MLKISVTLMLLLSFGLFATESNETNVTLKSTDTNTTAVVVDKKKSKEILKLQKKLLQLQRDTTNNEWAKIYETYIAHQNLINRKKELELNIKKYKRLRTLTDIQKKRLLKYEKEYSIIKDKIDLIKNFEKDPFNKLIAPPKLNDAPIITNPFSLISGLSYIKELSNKENEYIAKYKILNNLIAKLQEQQKIAKHLVALTNDKLEKERLSKMKKEIKYLFTIKDIFNTTKDVYKKKSDEIKLTLESDIKKELQKIVYIGVIALIFLVIFIFLKYLTKKYFSDKESFYTINKVINVSFITLIILTILFAYLENVSYLITILGFASAGIAIAMKDWFMSLMGWFVIVLGGAIHVGDRVKFVRGDVEYVGDIIDISLLRITLQEDITLTTYTVNRRAGRIIFIPNNYIFTDMIANYSHSGLKTVWDGIDFYITFNSNTSKATTIAKTIAKQYSKGYTDITRKQLNKLRSKYQLKNTNVEPRVFSFIEGYGIKISVWYLTNAYATLTLRSTISTKIIEEIRKEDDIKIAYQTQSVYFEKHIPKPTEPVGIQNEIKS